MGHMSASYGQFCPIAKASEIFATRWTPLIVRELMTGVHSFNDIHRGLPLISRAVLVARLRELEDHGVIERRPRGAEGAGHEYWLTPAGDGLRVVMQALSQWGMTYTLDRIKRSDLDPALLIWGLRKRVDLSTLPNRRVVLRFEFSGVPAARARQIAGVRRTRLHGSAVLGSVRLSLERGDLEPGPVGAPGTSTACLWLSLVPADSHGPAKMRGPARPQFRSEDRFGSKDE